MAFERLDQVGHGLGNQKGACLHTHSVSLSLCLCFSLTHLDDGYSSCSLFVQDCVPPQNKKKAFIILNSEPVWDYFICVRLQIPSSHIKLDKAAHAETSGAMILATNQKVPSSERDPV